MQDSYKIVSSSILYWFSQKKWFVFSIIFALIFISLPTPIGLSVPAYHSLIILFMVFILAMMGYFPDSRPAIYVGITWLILLCIAYNIWVKPKPNAVKVDDHLSPSIKMES